MYKLLPFILGEHRDLQSFTNDDMGKLYDGLHMLPARFRSPTSPYKNMSFEEIKMLDIPKEKRRALKTINDNFSSIRAIFTKACKDGVIDRNVADSVEYEIDQTPDKERRAPYDDNDIHTIFTHTHFTENKWRKVAKTESPAPYTFWLFPLALFTGARMNELLQLEKKNVTQFENYWYLDIKNEFDPKTGKKIKSVKNDNSIRKIPIADKLIQMGFLRFVESCKSNSLFPEVGKVKTGKKAAAKKLNYRLNSMGVNIKGQKTFHSLRHTFVTRAINMGAKPIFVGAVTGHLDKEEFKGIPELSNSYFDGHDVNILKKEVIDKLDYDVDFSGVEWPYS